MALLLYQRSFMSKLNPGVLASLSWHIWNGVLCLGDANSPTRGRDAHSLQEHQLCRRYPVPACVPEACQHAVHPK